MADRRLVRFAALRKRLFGYLRDDDVEWVVNDLAELGVKIGNQFFWLYKGGSLVYHDGTHDEGDPMMWRLVGKREFGECCHPAHFWRSKEPLPHRYTVELEYHPTLDAGIDHKKYRWQPLPRGQA